MNENLENLSHRQNSTEKRLLQLFSIYSLLLCGTLHRGQQYGVETSDADEEEHQLGVYIFVPKFVLPQVL